MKLHAFEGFLLVAMIATMWAGRAIGQSPPAGEAPAVPPAPPTARSLGAPGIAALGWLEGCWKGSVNKREFREVWLPQRGGTMIGVSQTVMEERTVDYEYLRIESRPDGVYYVVLLPGKPEASFKLSDETEDVDGAHTFVFLDPSREFPRRIAYRRASEGWLYAEIEGKVNGQDRRLYYPLRRVGCESGAVIPK